MAEFYPEDIFGAWYTEPGSDRSPNGNNSYRFGYKQDYSSAEMPGIPLENVEAALTEMAIYR